MPGLQPRALNRVEEELYHFFLMFRAGWVGGGDAKILKFDAFAAAITQTEPQLFDYLTPDLFHLFITDTYNGPRH